MGRQGESTVEIPPPLPFSPVVCRCFGRANVTNPNSEDSLSPKEKRENKTRLRYFPARRKEITGEKRVERFKLSGPAGVGDERSLSSPSPNSNSHWCQTRRRRMEEQKEKNRGVHTICILSIPSSPQCVCTKERETKVTRISSKIKRGIRCCCIKFGTILFQPDNTWYSRALITV